MKIFLIGAVNLFGFAPYKKPAFWQAKNCPTKRAPDKWDSAAFFDSFLASSFFCSQIESTPAPARVTQTVETVEKVGN